MTSISHYPHSLNTKYYAVLLYRNGNPISFVCRRYQCSKASLMRWIKNYIRRNPTISLCELYGKLRTEKGYSRHACSLFRIVRKLKYKVNTEHHSKYVPKKYDTPTNIGMKWQMDVKVIPKECYVGQMPDKFYQYTMIDEASRERFIYPYKEQSSYSTIDFVKRAIVYFGYKPKIIQTDNGQEFTYTMKTDKTHPLDTLLESLKITHKLIKPRTPRHNGKVERSHRNDQQRFYSYLKFYSYDDLLKQMKSYLKRSNNIPMQILGWLSPLQMRQQIIEKNNNQ